MEDDGIGIAAEDREKIWQRFWQADPARSGGGAGLGLAMVRWIAGAHGGSVTVQSTPVWAAPLPLPSRAKKTNRLM